MHLSRTGLLGLAIKMFAAIDIGSNSILLSIGKPDGNQLKMIVDECRVTGLAKGVLQGGSISSQALERSKTALREYRQTLDKHPEINGLKVVATESLRRPKNGEKVRKALSECIGSEIEIISGDREAELSFWSVQKEHPDQNQNKFVFDIGGASTELIFGNSTGILQAESLKFGSVLLTEEFRLNETVRESNALQSVESAIKKSRVYKEFQEAKCLGIGVAGTMTTLLAVQKKLRHYEQSKVHLARISQQNVFDWMNKVLALPLTEREKIVGLPKNRADIFGGGLVIIYALCRCFHWNEITCMDAGVRVGLLYEMLFS